MQTTLIVAPKWDFRKRGVVDAVFHTERGARASLSRVNRILADEGRKPRTVWYRNGKAEEVAT